MNCNINNSEVSNVLEVENSRLELMLNMTVNIAVRSIVSTEQLSELMIVKS